VLSLISYLLERKNRSLAGSSRVVMGLGNNPGLVQILLNFLAQSRIFLRLFWPIQLLVAHFHQSMLSQMVAVLVSGRDPFARCDRSVRLHILDNVQRSKDLLHLHAAAIWHAFVFGKRPENIFTPAALATLGCVNRHYWSLLWTWEMADSRAFCDF